MSSSPPVRMVAVCRDYQLLLEVPADADLDSSFRAVDLDSGDVLLIHGWLWTFEPADDSFLAEGGP